MSRQTRNAMQMTSAWQKTLRDRRSAPGWVAIVAPFCKSSRVTLMRMGQWAPSLGWAQGISLSANLRFYLSLSLESDLCLVSESGCRRPIADHWSRWHAESRKIPELGLDLKSIWLIRLTGQICEFLRNTGISNATSKGIRGLTSLREYSPAGHPER